jgi:TP901 family phage tail tape measure protein
MRKVFALFGTIALEGMSTVNKNLSAVDKEAKKAQKTIAMFGKNVEKAGASMMKFTAPLAAVGLASIKFGADFQKAMAGSIAIMGDLSDAMKKDMEMAARSVAKTTKFSATEAAESYYFLASAGLSAAQSIGALPKVASFAQAGNFNLARATDLLTDAQSALGLASKDTATSLANMTRVSDVLVKANTLANASVEQFSESLTNKAGAALRLLNKGVEEGVAVLAVYADQGLKGAAAGESLNIVMRDLQRAAIANKEQFRAAGISVFDANGNMRNMADIVSELEKRLMGMSDEQKRVELGLLGFTDKSISATTALLGTSDAIRNYEKQLKSAGGVTDEVAKKQIQNFWDQLGLLKSRLIDVGLTIYGTLEPILTNTLLPALNKVADAVEGAANWFDKLDPTLKNAIVRFGAIAVVMGPLLIIIGKVIVATKAFTAAVILNNAALAVNPIGAVIIAVAALTVGVWAAVEAYNALSVATNKMNNAQKSSERIQELSREYNDLKANIEAAGESAESVTWFDGQTFRTERLGVAKAELAGILAQIKFINGELNKPASAPAASGGGGGGGAPVVAGAPVLPPDNSEYEKAIAERKAIDADYQKQFNELTMNRLELLDLEKKEAIELAKEKGANLDQIETVFALRREQIEGEARQALLDSSEQIKNKRIADEKLVASEKKKLDDEEKQRIMEMANTAIDGLYQVFGIAQGINQNRMAELDISTAKEIASINATAMSEEEKQVKIQALEEQAAAKKKELMRKQAKQEKAAGIFSIIISTAQAIMKAVSQLGPIAGAIAGVLMGALGAAQIAVVASKPLPMKKGGLVKGGRGGVVAEVGEAESDEIVIPLRTGLDTFANMFIDKIKAIAMPDMSLGGMGSPAMAGAGGMVVNRTINLNIGNYYGDEKSKKDLVRAIMPIMAQENQRMGDE